MGAYDFYRIERQKCLNMPSKHFRALQRTTSPYFCGWVAEWLNAPVLKTGMGATPSGVRIPPRPPLLYQ